MCARPNAIIAVNACAIINSNWPYVCALGISLCSRIAGDKLWWSFTKGNCYERASQPKRTNEWEWRHDGKSTTAADGVASLRLLRFLILFLTQPAADSVPTHKKFFPNTFFAADANISFLRYAVVHHLSHPVSLRRSRKQANHAPDDAEIEIYVKRTRRREEREYEA